MKRYKCMEHLKDFPFKLCIAWVGNIMIPVKLSDFTVKRPTQTVLNKTVDEMFMGKIPQLSSYIRELRQYFKSRRGGSAGAGWCRWLAVASVHIAVSILKLQVVAFAGNSYPCPSWDIWCSIYRLWNVVTGHCPRSTTRWEQRVLWFSTESGTFQ